MEYKQIFKVSCKTAFTKYIPQRAVIIKLYTIKVPWSIVYIRIRHKKPNKQDVCEEVLVQWNLYA